MAKEDILLREEMERLKIEPMKINKNKNYGNPFNSNYKKGLPSRCSNLKCPCLQQKLKNNVIGKRKHSKFLKEPVLQIIKTHVSCNSQESEDHQENNPMENNNTDILNLCTLVKDCNQLKISNDLKTETLSNDTIDESKWWKQDVSNSRQNKESRVHSQTGSCSQQALNPPCDVTIDELASYFETLVHIPKKMSSMAEMMYI